MTMIREHTSYYKKAYRMPGFLRDPVLVFGFHKLVESEPHAGLKNWLEFWFKRYLPIGGVGLHNEQPPSEFNATTMQDVLRNFGAKDVQILDYFDSHADWIHDMNLPLPEGRAGQYGTLIDIGSIEHVFDTRQCMENIFRLVQVGGHVMMVTQCKGYYNHGFHLFSPECLLSAFEMNQFELKWVTYTTPRGLELDSPQWFPDVMIWIVAQKKAEVGSFQIPQQGRWGKIYNTDIST